MCFFFFSSRRRHTRCGRDWSSDVCSSDLVAEAVDARRRELAETLTLDQGKPLRAEAGDEVDELVAYFEMAAAEATRMEGLLPPSVDPRKRVLVQRVPRGVVAVISPWNWPYTM